MAKDKGDKKSSDAASAMDRFPAAMREAGARAAELAQNPVARSLLAAGLVTAAAALTSSKKVRANVQKASRNAFDSAEATADAATDNAAKIGAAIVTAATDAVRRMMEAGGVGNARTTPASEPTTAASPGGAGASRAKPASKRSASAKSPAAKAAKADGKTKTAKAARKAASPPKSATKTGAKASRKKGAARDPGIGANGN